MHCVLVGPGALGCLFTFYLARGIGREDSLQLLDYDRDRGRELNRQGLYCTHDGVERHTMVEVRSNPGDIRPADVVLLCVKSYDLAPCLERCQSFLHDDTLVVFMQNGISQLSYGEALAKGIPVFGTTSEGANITAPGRVIHAGVGETCFGGTAFSSAVENRLDHLIDILERSGLLVQQVDDIVDRLWAKLMVNVGINGLTAIHGCPNGDLLLEESLQDLMDDAVGEAAMVADQNGVLFEYPPRQLCHDICRRTAENISSMLQDVRRKRRTEIDSINGVIVSEGVRLGIATPVNTMIVERVKKLNSPTVSNPMRIPVEKIGFDFDGVIADTGENFIRMACEEYEYCSFKLEDITSFDVEGSIEMPVTIIHKIFNDILHDSLATGLKPLPGAKQTIEDMAAVGRVNVITARPLLEPMQAWFEQYFSPEVNARLNLIAAGHPDEKSRYIHDLGLQYFVDDRAETCHQLAGENITPFVFEQPWNRARHNFTSVRDWAHIRELLQL